MLFIYFLLSPLTHSLCNGKLFNLCVFVYVLETYLLSILSLVALLSNRTYKGIFVFLDLFRLFCISRCILFQRSLHRMLTGINNLSHFFWNILRYHLSPFYICCYLLLMCFWLFLSKGPIKWNWRKWSTELPTFY